MKEIIIKPKIDSTFIRFYKIKIYEDDNLIVDTYNTKNSFIFCGESNKTYRLIIIHNHMRFITNFIIDDRYDCPYIINFSSSNNIVTIYLFDRNYPRLRIEKGVIYLWPSLIQ